MPPFSEKGASSDNLQILSTGGGRAILSSSKDDQSSYVRKDGQMSIFTYHLIEALTGHYQPGEDAIEVLVYDIMSYVTRSVPRTAMNEFQ